jgi:hypothetical protein
MNYSKRSIGQVRSEEGSEVKMNIMKRKVGKLMSLLALFCLIIGSLSVTSAKESADSVFLDSLESLLRDEANLLDSFEYLLGKTSTTVEENVEFLASFEDLLRRQAVLSKGFEDLLKLKWECMPVEEQEKFLASFEDLLKRESHLYFSFQSLLDKRWDELSSDEQAKFLRSFEDLLRRQTMLLKSYEDLFKMKHGGICIEKSSDKAIIDCEETVTYTYTIRNFYSNKAITDIIIIDDKLGTIADKILLAPGETKSFTKSTTLSESICNQARVLGEDDDGKLVCDYSNIVCVLVRGGGIPEPVQYGQYCEASKVEGNGIIDVSTSIVDKEIALNYVKSLSGNGDIAIDSENLLSEKASKLKRPVQNKTVPLNFYKTVALEYSGEAPLSSVEKVSSKEFDGGIGADVVEMFSVIKMEQKQTLFFASTDPTTNVNNFTEAEMLDKSTPVHLVGINTENTFNGTWGTESRWHKMLRKDIYDHQSFTGIFETSKLIKFHEKPVCKPIEDLCEGIDC